MTTPGDNKTEGDTRFEENARAAFAASVERIDAATLSKLNRGRQAALAELVAASPAKKWLQWAPAAGIAAAIAFVVLQGTPTATLPGASDTLADDFEILLGSDDLDMIEDLEFYSWIELADSGSPDNVG